MATAIVNDTRINYEVYGPEGAAWVVLSHSLASSLQMWEPQVELLKQKWRVLAYDMRGHGESDAPPGPYRLELLADDVVGLLGHVGASKAHFIGLSIGGMVGQVLALRKPEIVDCLVLADTGHGVNADAIKQWQDRIVVAETKGMAALVEVTMERWFTEGFRSSAPAARMAHQIARTPVAGYVGCAQAITQMEMTQHLGQIKKPVLAIAGEFDGSAQGTRFIAERVPGARFVMLPNAAHISNIEQAAAFNKAITDFLRPDRSCSAAFLAV